MLSKIYLYILFISMKEKCIKLSINRKYEDKLKLIFFLLIKAFDIEKMYKIQTNSDKFEGIL